MSIDRGVCRDYSVLSVSKGVANYNVTKKVYLSMASRLQAFAGVEYFEVVEEFDGLEPDKSEGL